MDFVYRRGDKIKVWWIDDYYIGEFIWYSYSRNEAQVYLLTHIATGQPVAFNTEPEKARLEDIEPLEGGTVNDPTMYDGSLL